MEADVILVGASVRAAAQSARRGGLQPWCADLFGDQDLRLLGPVTVIAPSAYPHGLPEILRAAPSGPWMYTGALENYPDVIDRVAAERPLWGNPGTVLSQVRNPVRLHAVLTAAGFAMPKTTTSPVGLPCDGSWLIKPLRSAGGTGITPWYGQELPSRTCYWQALHQGEPRSALFLADGMSAWCLGWARQLIGKPWLCAAPFHFCGAVGPLPLTAAVASELSRLGQTLTQSFRLRGVFGVDFLWNGQTLCILEVNPRYPASAELYERALGLSIVALQRRLFSGSRVREIQQPVPSEPEMLCKAVLYAPRNFIFPREFAIEPTRLTEMADEAVADLPVPGSTIAAGRPILTVLAPTEAAARERAAALYDSWGLTGADRQSKRGDGTAGF